MKDRPSKLEAAPRTVVNFLRVTQEHLSRKGFENPRLEAELLLGHVLGLDRVGLYLQFDRPLLPDEINRFRFLLRHRLNREPLQWILGEMEFFGIRLLMRPGVFVPRPETELLVEITNRCIGAISPPVPGGKQKRGEKVAGRRKNKPDRADHVFRVLDIGTGSGAIALAVAASIPEVIVFGCDISEKALELARENARILSNIPPDNQGGIEGGLVEERVKFGRWDIMDFRIPTFFETPYHWITMNPPYVQSEDWDSLPHEVKAEPRTALDGGEDGLRFYRRLLELLPDILVKGGGVSVEIGTGQADPVSRLFEGLFQEITCTPDYNGIERVICGLGFKGDGS